MMFGHRQMLVYADGECEVDLRVNTYYINIHSPKSLAILFQHIRLSEYL